MKARPVRVFLTLLPGFLVAFILSVLVPPWSTGTDWFINNFDWRPEWSLLVLIYWTIMLPDRVGVLSGWMVGLMEDLLHGSPLGRHALTYMLAAWFTVSFHQHLRSQALWQQTLSVLLLTGCSQLLLSSLSGRFLENLPATLTATLVSALLWPSVVLCLHGFRNRATH